MAYFDKVKRNFGFGCMRFQMKDGAVDLEAVKQQVDRFLDEGFNYFDTAHGYLEGKSELALREALVRRHDRESFTLTNKLTDTYFKTEADIRPFFQSQLEACGVEYFDFYLMHAQNKHNYEHFKQCHAYETALALRDEGKIHHFGISFHDSPEVLEQILTDYPQIEVVQIQLNYIDFDAPAVQSRRCYEVCRKFGKPVIVMEPVKGGHLANLTEDAAQVLTALGGGSPASYAIRFAASFEGIFMVLSGMSSNEQLEDNLSFMKDFRPLDAGERAAVEEVCRIMNEKRVVACTACRYCVEGCPQRINIPGLFSCMNAKQLYRDWNADYYYNIRTQGRGKASDCIECGACEQTCPQHLPIRSLLKDVAKEFEK